MNKVILVGNLAFDNELKELTSEKGTFKKIENCIAVRRTKEESDFIYFDLFNNAETFAQYTSKGTKVLLEGRIQVDNYTDKDGNKKSRMKVMATNFEFISSGKKEDTNTATSAPVSEAAVDDDLPF